MFSIGNKSLFFLSITMGFIGMILVFQAGIQAQRVVPDFSMLGATYLVNKTVGALEQWARRLALLSAFVTVAAAALLTAATWFISEVGHDRWTQRGVFHLLIGLGAVAAFAFAYVVGSLYLGRSRAPFPTTCGWSRRNTTSRVSRIRCRLTIRYGCARSPNAVSRCAARRPIASSWERAICLTARARI